MKKFDLRSRLAKKRRGRWIKLVTLAILGFILLKLFFNITIKLPINAEKPVDAILVLGGSIRREIYVADLSKQYPNIPILISQGSKDPCVRFIFEQKQARLSKVWLEKCANSTFENFFFSVPILRNWRVHKVKLVTSNSHLPRAKYLGYILLESQGIAMELDIAKEWGIPGNRESRLKTTLDVTRSLIWAVFSQLISPPCSNLIPLINVDLKAWENKGFKCEKYNRL
jgi:uncharacterized SAM-binding protein YcdF (DUF218 family)